MTSPTPITLGSSSITLPSTSRPPAIPPETTARAAITTTTVHLHQRRGNLDPQNPCQARLQLLRPRPILSRWMFVPPLHLSSRQPSQALRPHQLRFLIVHGMLWLRSRERYRPNCQMSAVVLPQLPAPLEPFLGSRRFFNSRRSPVFRTLARNPQSPVRTSQLPLPMPMLTETG